MSDQKEILMAVVQYLSRLTGVAEAALSEETRLGQDGLGLDSIGCLELLLSVEQTCGFRLRNEDLTGDPFVSIGSLVAYVAAMGHV